MKIKLMMTSLVMVGLGACSQVPTEQTAPKIGMPNPASQYCIDQGGSLTIKNEEKGQVGYCTLKNGEVYEEWAYFRNEHGQCKPEAAEKLLGQQGLSHAEIKTLTNSKVIRELEPGQPATADYRIERITIVKDPQTQKIVTASCG